MVVDEFALKAMVEQEDDDILISKVRLRSSSSNSQNDKLIAALQVAIIVGLLILISPFALLHHKHTHHKQCL